MTLPSHLEVGAVPDSLPPNKPQREGKNPRRLRDGGVGWRPVAGASQGASMSWYRECLGLLSSAAPVATHLRQGNVLHVPSALGSTRHQLPPPSISGLRSLDTPGPTGTSAKLIPVLSNGHMGLTILRIQQEREQCFPHNSGAPRRRSGFHRSCPTL